MTCGQNIISSQNKNARRPFRTEGVEFSRGTTSGSPQASQSATSCRANTRPARYRAHPANPTWQNRSGGGSGGYSQKRPLSLSPNREFSLQGCMMLLFPIITNGWNYIIFHASLSRSCKRKLNPQHSFFLIRFFVLLAFTFAISHDRINRKRISLSSFA